MLPKHRCFPLLVLFLVGTVCFSACKNRQPEQASAVLAAAIPLQREGTFQAIKTLSVPPASVLQNRDVVVIVLDDLGYGDAGFMGHPDLRTPHLDTLASQSVVATFAHSPAAYCTPSRAGFLTGQSPNRTGAYHWGHGLRAGRKTLAHAFGEAGFRTMLAGKWHLGSVAAKGFSNPSDAGFAHWSASLNFHDTDPWFSRQGMMLPLTGEAADRTTDEALRLWGTEEGNPRFLWVAYSAPHTPHIASDAYRKHYAHLPPKRAAYYAEIEAMDAALGRFLHAIPPETVVALVSDNGGIPQLSQTGGRGAKGGYYEGGLRIPFMLRVSGVLLPGQTAAPISGLDLAPTLLELMGLPPLPFTDGQSLLGDAGLNPYRSMGFWAYPAPGIRTPSDLLMAEFATADWTVFPFEREQRAWSDKRDFVSLRFPGHSAWIQDRWKLHREESGTGRVQWSLYNLRADSLEAIDMTKVVPDRFQTMRNELEAWLTGVLADMQSGS